MYSNHPPLASAWWPSTAQNRILRTVLLAVAGSLLLTFSAKFKVPYWPVPVTMQTFVVLSLGMIYGWRHAAAAVLLYLGEGAVGFPVFAGGGGIAYMIGPTGGYLLGFFVAAVAAGFMAERGMDRNFFLVLLALLIADALVFVFGVSWLGKFIGFEKAINVGLIPFLFGELSKIVLAAAIVTGCRIFAPQPRD